MKVIGQDIIDFWKTWPGWRDGDVYCEDVPLGERSDGTVVWLGDGGEYNSDDEAPAVDPARKYDLAWGALGWQQMVNGVLTARPADFDDDLVRCFRKWLKARTHKVLAIEVPVGDVAEITELCKLRKWVIR